MTDDELVLLRAGLDAEMRKSGGIADSVGAVGEQLAIERISQNFGPAKAFPSLN